MSIEFIKNHVSNIKPNHCYILSVLSRKKNNDGMSDTQQLFYRNIIYSISDVEKSYNELVAKAHKHDLSFYMYISANQRSLTKALNRYTKLLLDLREQMETDKNCLARFNKLNSEWFSCLESPSSRGERNFIIDLDDKSKFYDAIEIIQEATTILSVRETRNGYHILTKPFDFPQAFKNFETHDSKGNKIIEFKPDALMFVEDLK